MFPIEKTSVEDWVSCDFCGGTGKITGRNDKERGCPECYSKGKRQRFISTPQVGMKTTIVRMDIVCGNRVEEYYAGKNGAYLSQKDIFSSYEEAKEECEKRSKETHYS